MTSQLVIVFILVVALIVCYVLLARLAQLAQNAQIAARTRKCSRRSTGGGSEDRLVDYIMQTYEFDRNPGFNNVISRYLDADAHATMRGLTDKDIDAIRCAVNGDDSTYARDQGAAPVESKAEAIRRALETLCVNVSAAPPADPAEVAQFIEMFLALSPGSRTRVLLTQTLVQVKELKSAVGAPTDTPAAAPTAALAAAPTDMPAAAPTDTPAAALVAAPPAALAAAPTDMSPAALVAAPTAALAAAPTDTPPAALVAAPPAAPPAALVAAPPAALAAAPTAAPLSTNEKMI